MNSKNDKVYRPKIKNIIAFRISKSDTRSVTNTKDSIRLHLNIRENFRITIRIRKRISLKKRSWS